MELTYLYLESLCRDIIVLGETTASTLIDISLAAVTDLSTTFWGGRSTQVGGQCYKYLLKNI